MCADTVTIKRTQQAPPPPKGLSGTQLLMGGLCRSEVDKMVDVNVPLTMNWRSVNISKHKGQGCCRCLSEGTNRHSGCTIFPRNPLFSLCILYVVKDSWTVRGLI